MKKLFLTTLSVIMAASLLGCSPEESAPDAGVGNGSLPSFGSSRDKRLTYFDLTEDLNNSRLISARSIPNNTSNGYLLGRVQFAQTHTVDPNSKLDKDRKEPLIIPYRTALLMFTPQREDVKKIDVKITGSKLDKPIEQVMASPYEMPKSDYTNGDGRPDITYSKRSYSIQIPYNYVIPEMQIEFTAEMKDGSRLTSSLDGKDIEFGAPIEGVFTFIRLGMLTYPPQIFSDGNNCMTYPYNFSMLHHTERGTVSDITNPKTKQCIEEWGALQNGTLFPGSANAMAEFFQTYPYAKLVNSYYETRMLNRVILSSGKIYDKEIDKASDDKGGGHYGDMREDVAKATVSVGINQANQGVVDATLDQNYYVNHDMFVFTVHFAKGAYKQGDLIANHGLSGGNGIGTFHSSSGNEFSHEVGHGTGGTYHWPHLATTRHGSVHSYETGWGYSAYHNRFIANIQWQNTDVRDFEGPNGCGSGPACPKYFLKSFQDKYLWNQDSMASGHPVSDIVRYTLNTKMTTRGIQDSLSHRYFLSDGRGDNGKYFYRGWDKENKKYHTNIDENFKNRRPQPTEKGVPVITILGAYDPGFIRQDGNSTVEADKLQSAKEKYVALLYPYFRGNYGNIFPEFFHNNKPTDTKSYLQIEYYDGKATQYIKLTDYRHTSDKVNRFNINIPEKDKPSRITLFVNNTNKGVTEINKSVYDTPLAPAIIIGREDDYYDVIDEDIEILNLLIKDGKVGEYKLNHTEKNKFIILDRYGKLDDNKLNYNVKEIGREFIKDYKAVREIDVFMTNNYSDLETGNQTVIKNLIEKFDTYKLGTLSTNTYGKIQIHSKCLAVNNDKKLSFEDCNESNKGQKWAMDVDGRIRSALFPTYCLDGSNKANIVSCSGSNHQKWTEFQGHGTCIKNAGNNQCLNNDNGNLDKLINSCVCGGGGNQSLKADLKKDKSKYFGLMNNDMVEELWKYSNLLDNTK